MKNQINCTLTLEDKSFVNKEGQVIDYVALTLTIDGEDVRVSVKKEDKGLLRILRRDMPRVEE